MENYEVAENKNRTVQGCYIVDNVQIATFQVTVAIT